MDGCTEHGCLGVSLLRWTCVFKNDPACSTILETECLASADSKLDLIQFGKNTWPRKDGGGAAGQFRGPGVRRAGRAGRGPRRALGWALMSLLVIRSGEIFKSPLAGRLLACAPMAERVNELRSASHGGTNPGGGPTLMTSSDPEHLPKSQLQILHMGGWVSTHWFWGDTNIQSTAIHLGSHGPWSPRVPSHPLSPCWVRDGEGGRRAAERSQGPQP